MLFPCVENICSSQECWGSHWEGNCAQNHKREEVHAQKYPCNKTVQSTSTLEVPCSTSQKLQQKIFHSQNCFLTISPFLLHFLGAFILSLLQILFFNNWHGECTHTSSFLCCVCCSGCCELLSGSSLAWPGFFFSSGNTCRKCAKLKPRINATQTAALRVSSELPYNYAFPWIRRQVIETQKCFLIDKSANQGCLFLPGIFTQRASLGQRGISIIWADVT